MKRRDSGKMVESLHSVSAVVLGGCGVINPLKPSGSYVPAILTICIAVFCVYVFCTVLTVQSPVLAVITSIKVAYIELFQEGVVCKVECRHI